MRLVTLGLDRDLPTVVVLGAGASRGSSCVSRSGVQPPLDADFFAQAQRLPSNDLAKRDRDLFVFVREEFGQVDPPTLEVFFTQVAAVDRFHREFNIRGRPSGRFGRQLKALRQLIPRVFAAALSGRDCLWHERIAASLRAGDAVMSFNYDTLMDRALRVAGAKRWDPGVGYGFDTDVGVDAWAPAPSPGPVVKSPIKLLKPHGSLNWSIDLEASVVSLIEEYSPQTSESIVPPTWDKSDVTNWPWNEVWRSARGVLGPARLLIVVGYSVPVTDQMSQALLRADVTRLEGLVVVNPDASARRRVIDTMSSALDRNTPVIELSTLEEFATYLPAAPSEKGTPSLDKQVNELRNNLFRLTGRLEQLTAGHEDMSREHQELRDEFDSVEWRVDDLEESDLADDVERLAGELRDLDTRLDSLSR